MYGRNKILSLRSNNTRKQRHKKKYPKKMNKLHPVVRKRRLFYLCWMVLFLFWFVIELIIQQGKIWNQEEKLANTHKELAILEQENKGLQKEVKRLKSPDYLIELVHKLGYSKPKEENYHLE